MKRKKSREDKKEEGRGKGKGQKKMEGHKSSRDQMVRITVKH